MGCENGKKWQKGTALRKELTNNHCVHCKKCLNLFCKYTEDTYSANILKIPKLLRDKS